MLSFNKPITIGSGKWKLAPFRFYNKGEMWSLGNGKVTPDWREITLKGVGALSLVNAKKDGLTALKLFGTTEQRNLPNEYTQVEYLEGTGTQYIDTGIILKSKATITTVGQFMSVSSPNPLSMWGFMAPNSNVPRWGCSVYNTMWLMDLNSTTTRVTANTDKHTFVNKTDGTTTYDCLVDGVQIYGGQKVLNQPNLYASNTLSAYIFARNNSNTAGNFSSSRIYSFNIVQDDIEVINLIPCRRNSDSVLGMYDTVTGNFLTNQGTGTFTAGADVTPTPDTPMDIVCNNGALKLSPNLFDKNNTLSDGQIWGNATGGQSSLSGYYGVNPIKVKGGHTYTRSGSHGGANYFLLDDNTSFFVQDSSDTITVPYNAVMWYFNNTVSTNRNTMMIVEGNVLPAIYMSYGAIYTDGTQETVEVDTTGDTASAEMLLQVGDYKDVQSILDGAVTRNVGVKVFDGTENWFAYGGGAGYQTTVQNMLSSTSGAYFCTHAIAVSGITSKGIRFGAGNKILYWCQINTTFTTVEQFKQYLADQYANGTPCIIIYPLSSPITESVSPQPLTIQQGTNIIEITGASINNLPLEVSYKAGVSVTIQEVTSANLDNSVQVTIG